MPAVRRSLIWVALGAAVIPFLALVHLAVVDPVIAPRVHIQWQDAVTAEARTALETRHGLRNGELIDPAAGTWRYDLGDASRANIQSLIENPAVGDTGYIDREAFAPEGHDVPWYRIDAVIGTRSRLLQLQRSLWFVLGGGGLLWAAGSANQRRRRNIAIATLLLAGSIALVYPFEPSFITMGGSADHERSRADFEHWFAGRIRFEKHLTNAILLTLYPQFGPSEAAPAHTLAAVARGATVWFLALALVIGALERWSAVVLRYLGLALLAPAALLYFGWREFGYLSLNLATFPLLVRGLRGDTRRLSAASACAGLGAALHGSGLVGLAGTWLAALGAQGTWPERIGRVTRVVAWGTLAYVGWVAIYILGMNLSLSADPGPTVINSWRPLFDHELRAGRMAAALLSPTGARDVLMSAWIVGVPLIAVALSVARQAALEVRTLLWYLPPSIVFLVYRWPFDGIGGGIDLVVAVFPAFYALAWTCAQDRRTTAIAALLLMSAHYAFWEVVLDPRFATR
jgi:hypothetical protein